MLNSLKILRGWGAVSAFVVDLRIAVDFRSIRELLLRKSYFFSLFLKPNAYMRVHSILLFALRGNFEVIFVLFRST